MTSSNNTKEYGYGGGDESCYLEGARAGGGHGEASCKGNGYGDSDSHGYTDCSGYGYGQNWCQQYSDCGREPGYGHGLGMANYAGNKNGTGK